MQNLKHNSLFDILIHRKNRETHNIKHCEQTKWQIALKLQVCIEDSGTNWASNLVIGCGTLVQLLRLWIVLEDFGLE